MSDRESAFDEELRAAFGAPAGPPGHPPVTALAAWRRGDLGAAESAAVERHLAACRECVDLLLDLADVERPGAGAESDLPADGEVAAAVQEVVDAAFGRRRSAPAPRTWLRALAATLLLGTIGLGVFAARLVREKRRLEADLAAALLAPGWERPQAGVPVVDLYPRGFTPRGPGEGQRVEVPRGAGLVVLILTPPASATVYPAYRVALVGAGGRELWQAPATAGDGGSFVVALPRRWAEERGLTVRLTGRGEDGGERVVEQYAIEFDLR
jgi:hypothetical protein